MVIAGDLFEKEEDLADDKIWQDAGSEVINRFLCSVAEPKLFETWSRSRSRNKIFNKHFLQSIWKMLR